MKRAERVLLNEETFTIPLDLESLVKWVQCQFTEFAGVMNGVGKRLKKLERANRRGKFFRSMIFVSSIAAAATYVYTNEKEKSDLKMQVIDLDKQVRGLCPNEDDIEE